MIFLFVLSEFCYKLYEKFIAKSSVELMNLLQISLQLYYDISAQKEETEWVCLGVSGIAWCRASRKTEMTGLILRHLLKWI